MRPAITPVRIIRVFAATGLTGWFHVRFKVRGNTLTVSIKAKDELDAAKQTMEQWA